MTDSRDKMGSRDQIGSHDETVVIPIADERLVVSRREVETGRVRVRTVIDEKQEMVREELSRTAVDIERIAIDVEVDTIPEPRMEGDTYIIPVVEEVLYVRKALVVVEEVRLHRQTSTEKVEQAVTVRSQRAVVERDEPRGSSQSTPRE